MKRTLAFFVIAILALMRDGKAEDGNFGRGDQPLPMRKCTEDINFTQPMFSKLTDDQRRMLLEYHRVYPRLVDFYDNCSMTVHHASHGLLRPTDKPGLPPPPGRNLDEELRSITRYVYYANGGGRYRLDRSKWSFMDTTPLTDFTGVITPTESYVLRPVAAGGFSVVLHKKTDNDDLNRLRDYVFVNASYAYTGMPLQFLLFRKPGFGELSYTIDRVAVAQENRERIATISISFKNKRGTGNIVLRLLPNYAWALQEVVATSALDSEKASGDCDYSFVRCAYKKGRRRMPLLSEMLREDGLKRKDGTIELLARDKYTVESFVVGAAEMSKFDVEKLVGHRP